MDLVEILLIVGSIVISVLFAAILTCFLSKGCNRKAQTTKSLGTNFSSNDDDVEAQRETYNGDNSGSPASRNSDGYTISHWQHSNVHRSRPEPVDSNSEARHSGNAVQSSHPNYNYHDETLRNTYIKTSGNNTIKNSRKQHQQSLPLLPGERISESWFPLEMFTPSRQDIDSDSGDTINTYAELDLHIRGRKKPMYYFEIFLGGMINEYKRNPNSSTDRHITVITGKGLHSEGGIPKIKPAVEDYLNKHNYKFEYPNGNEGRVKIDLTSAR